MVPVIISPVPPSYSPIGSPVSPPSVPLPPPLPFITLLLFLLLLTVPELKAFLGTMILMGTIKLPTLQSYWTDLNLSQPSVYTYSTNISSQYKTGHIIFGPAQLKTYHS